MKFKNQASWIRSLNEKDVAEFATTMLESFRSFRKFFSGYSDRVEFRRKLTAEALRAQSKESFIKRYSDLCELCVSAVK